MIEQAAPQPGLAESLGLKDHVIICGLGNLGYRIYLQLEKLGIPVLVVDKAADAQFADRVESVSKCLLRADPREPEVLAQVGIADACALITSYDSDLMNLQIVLNVLRIRSDLRIVMRFFNVQIEPGIRAALPNVVLLSVSALASPTFVIAATDRYARNAMTVDGQELVIDEIASARATTVRDLGLDDALVLACRGADGGDVLFPPDQQPIAEGDRLIVVGPATSLTALPEKLNQRPAQPQHQPQNGLRMAANRFTTLLTNLDPALYITLLALLGLIIVSVGIFVASRHMDPLEALYAVIMAVTTTDLGEFDPRTDPIWLRPYGVFLLIAGVASLTIIYAFVTNYVVSVKLSGLLGQRPVTMRDHIVLCGLGTVGYRVLEGLIARGERVAVIERGADNRFLPLVRAHPQLARVFVADARLLQSLELVNVAAARCIITATDDDLGNIETALNARQLNPTIRVVLRTFDQALAQQVATNFNIQIAFSATALAASAFVSAALGHSVVQTVAVGDNLISVVRMEVAANSRARGKRLRDLTDNLEARVLYHTRRKEQPVFCPAPERLLAAGDVLVLVADDDALAPLKERLA